MCQSKLMKKRKIGCFSFKKLNKRKIMSKTIINVYHEKQVKELCALHALNNLFQNENAFTKPQLDEICHNLSPDVWINPHKSLLGLGNYDINVIMKALQINDYEAIWFDKRKDPSCLNLNNIFGFILNVPTDYRLGFVLLPLKRRHWITIRQIDDNYYNLDSKLDSPQLIGKGPDLIQYLKEQLECRDKELFIVVSRDVENVQGWLLNTEPSYFDHIIANNIEDDISDRDAEVVKLSDITNSGECDDNICVEVNPLCDRT